MKVDVEQVTRTDVIIRLSGEEAEGLYGYLDDNDYGSFPAADYVGVTSLIKLLREAPL